MEWLERQIALTHDETGAWLEHAGEFDLALRRTDRPLPGSGAPAISDPMQVQAVEMGETTSSTAAQSS